MGMSLGAGQRALSEREREVLTLLADGLSLREVSAELVREGHRLRIYTPFGRHWDSYSLRRLQENPKIAGYIAADTFNRLLPGRNGA